MDIEKQQQLRYDRQIRLWGDEGQISIQQARVCVFGSTALAAETLKSLVLAGIGSFHIIDRETVDHCDLGQNFFLDESSLGKYRGECLVKFLTELNPSVHGQHHPLSFSEFKRQDFQMLLQFSLIITTNMLFEESRQLDQFLFEHGIPVVYARIFGMLGYLRLSFREHHIWNCHSENDAYDLRMDNPFPELLKLASETDLNSMTHEQHSHTPYVLLYFKALDIWKRGRMETDSFPDINSYKIRKEFEQILMKMRQPDEKGSLDEQNFMEAKQNLLKGMGRTKVPENVKKVLSDPKAEIINDNMTNGSFNKISKEWLEPFWIFAGALRQFIERSGGFMPISGQLPDMTSDSKRYAQLLGVYRDKSIKDSAQLFAFANELVAARSSLFPSRTISSFPCEFMPYSDVNLLSSGNSSVVESMADSGTDDEATTTADESDDVSRMSTSDPIDHKAIDNAISTTSMDYSSEGKSEESNELMQVERNPISLELCQSFIKTAAKIDVQYGSSLATEYSSNLAPLFHQIEPADMTELPPRIDPICWYILLRASDRFWSVKRRFPGSREHGESYSLDRDAEELKKHIRNLFTETGDMELIARQEELVPSDAVREMCRYGTTELHAVAAILGGCAAQEVIKLCTHQYVPLDNSLIFDGHSQKARKFRLPTDN